ncbi:hypothetical protein FXF51_05945 [Nonomuraea sp. PA05]|uniref:hypothetical protein n=1 Tax=Nonomuraea sp. PA05 TaxID=2604466 RepID=UPI0011DB656D|nr:hypothetical protein [Nonomuraea sp. PA05]TYB69702.1 hypothetical protein FXF51_05945 [Nonomuraea sp. PA05]
MPDDLHVLIRRAINDPGTFTTRREGETVGDWAARAVPISLRSGDDDMVTVMAGDIAIALAFMKHAGDAPRDVVRRLATALAEQGMTDRA